MRFARRPKRPQTQAGNFTTECLQLIGDTKTYPQNAASSLIRPRVFDAKAKRGCPGMGHHRPSPTSGTRDSGRWEIDTFARAGACELSVCRGLAAPGCYTARAGGLLGHGDSRPLRPELARPRACWPLLPARARQTACPRFHRDSKLAMKSARIASSAMRFMRSTDRCGRPLRALGTENDRRSRWDAVDSRDMALEVDVVLALLSAVTCRCQAWLGASTLGEAPRSLASSAACSSASGAGCTRRRRPNSFSDQPLRPLPLAAALEVATLSEDLVPSMAAFSDCHLSGKRGGPMASTESKAFA